MRRFAIPLCACLALLGLGVMSLSTTPVDQAPSATAAMDGSPARAEPSRPAAGPQAREVSSASRFELRVEAPTRERRAEELELEALASERRAALIERNLARLERAAEQAEARGQGQQAERLRQRAAYLEEMRLAG